MVDLFFRLPMSNASDLAVHRHPQGREGKYAFCLSFLHSLVAMRWLSILLVGRVVMDPVDHASSALQETR